MMAKTTQIYPILICTNCGEPFKPTVIDKSHKRTRKYCSRECRHIAVKRNGTGWSMTPKQKKMCSERMRVWWANCSPEQRHYRSRGIREAAKTEAHRERMRTNRITYGRLGREDKKTIRSSVNPTVSDLHWAAGFLEGEGSFRPNGGSTDVQASQVNIEPLMKLQRLFGGSIKKRQGQKINYSDFYLWFTSGPRSRGVMMTLYILMSKRRQAQIDKALGWTGG